jgi:hypothetical protein
MYSEQMDRYVEQHRTELARKDKRNSITQVT